MSRRLPSTVPIYVNRSGTHLLSLELTTILNPSSSFHIRLVALPCPFFLQSAHGSFLSARIVQDIIIHSLVSEYSNWYFHSNLSVHTSTEGVSVDDNNEH